MHIFCTECGKHIDVSLEELENQQGHLVCPQCLAEIDVDVEQFGANATQVPTGGEQQQKLTPAPQQAPPSISTPPAMPATPPPIAKQQATPTSANTTQHIDDVLRYCKHCGAFLREGVNFCPKCGKYVRVSAPPASTPSPTQAQQAARLKAGTPPEHHAPQNRQSTYRQPTYQSTPVKQQRKSNSARNSRNGSKPSQFSIMSLGGCLTVTIIAVALFFIIYIIIGVNFE